MEWRYKLCVLAAIGAIFLNKPNCFCQDLGSAIGSILEEITENSADPDDEWLEYLYTLIDQPLNLNAASRDELDRLKFLTAFQVENLHVYIYSYGQMQSIYELLAIDGFDDQTLRWLQPFVVVQPVKVASYSKYQRNDTLRFFGESLVRVSKIMEGNKGLDQGKFIGSPWQMLWKQRLEFKDYTIGVTYEKDAGESFWNPVTGPEYLSFAFEYKGNNTLRHLIIGDYRVNFGQGVGLSQNTGFGKSSMVMHNIKTGINFVKHTSASEYGYFRGAAATFSFDRLELSAFGSYRNIDGTVDNFLNKEVLTSMGKTGYHRTELERERRSNVGQYAIGSRLTGRFNQLKVGSSLHLIRFEMPWMNIDGMPQTKMGSAGADLLVAGSDYLLWGEGGMDFNGNLAGVAGFNLYPAGRFSLSIIARSFEGSYETLYSSPFSEGGRASNEKGIYIGFELLPLPGLKLQSYFDLFQFPYPRLNADMPSQGMEALSLATCTFSQKTVLNARVKVEQKERNSLNENYNVLKPYTKFNARIELKTNTTDVMTFRSRIEYVRSTYNGSPEEGWMAFQDMYVNMNRPQLQVGLRAAFFSTESYQSAIYVYEPDVLYAFSVPVYYGHGMRYLLNLRFKTLKGATLYFKLGRFIYFDRETIGSGATTIDGSAKTEARIQLRYKF